MTMSYQRQDELYNIFSKLDAQNPDVATLIDIFGELTMLLQVKSVDLDETNSQLLEKEERLKLYKDNPVSFSDENSILQKMSNDLVEERKKNIKLTGEIEELAEQLQILKTGDVQCVLLNKKILEKDRYIEELGSNLSLVKKQHDEIIRQYNEQKELYCNNRDVLHEKEQQFQNIYGLYQSEKNKRESAIQEKHDIDIELKSVCETLNAEKAAHFTTQKSLQEQKDIVMRLQNRQGKYEELSVQVMNKNQLVQKLSAELTNERKLRETLNQEVKKLEVQVDSISELKTTFSVEKEKLLQENKSRIEQYDLLLSNFGELSNTFANVVDSRDQLSHQNDILTKKNTELQQIRLKLESQKTDIHTGQSTKLYAESEEKNNELAKLETSIDAKDREISDVRSALQKEINQRLCIEKKLADFSNALTSLETEKSRADCLERECRKIQKQAESHKHDYDVQSFEFKTVKFKYEEEMRKYAAMKHKCEELLLQNEQLQEEDADTQKIIAKFTTDPVAKELHTKILQEKVKTINKDHYSAVRALEIEIARLRAINADKERLIENSKNNAFTRHLEGNLKQHKAKIDSLMFELGQKNAEITVLKSKKAK